MHRYTVVIPTRDRAETLIHTLKTCTRQSYNNLDIIVCDNHSNDKTQQIVEECPDRRVRYIRPSQRLSMSGNFEFALSHVSDGFITIIGSDDGLLPGAIETVNDIVKKYEVKAVSCRQATYVWPDFNDQSIAGRLIFGFKNTDVEIRTSENWIHRALTFQDVYTFDLPNLYCGFVHRDVINRAIRDGVFFRSINPDAYAAFAIALHEKRYAFSHTPFVIAGASSKSNGASTMHPGADTTEAQKFFSENDLPFHSDYEHIPCLEIAAAEAFAQAADAFPSLASSFRVDRHRLLASAMRTSNSKTRTSITGGVQRMAEKWNIPLKEIDRIHARSLQQSVISIMSTLYSLFSKRFVEISDSRGYHVQSIDDAALLAGALMRMNKGALPLTARQMALRSFANRLFRRSQSR